MIIARLALESDRAAIHELGRMMVDEFRAHVGYDEAVANKTIDSYLLGAEPTIFVAEQSRQVIGLLLARTPPYLYASSFFVTQEVFYIRPDKRGTRAAAELARLFNEWADRLGPSEVYMGVATGYRAEQTACLMKRFGFKPVGQHLIRICGRRS